MITNQAYLFIIFALNGMFIGILFDFFRILRKSFKTNDLITYIEDIIFWILTGLSVLYSIFIFNNGEIRFFMFLGIFLGLALYMLCFSQYIIKINVYIINIIKRIIKTITQPIFKLFKLIKKIFFKPIYFLIINTKNILKATEKLKITLKNTKLSKNNVKKGGILK